MFGLKKKDMKHILVVEDEHALRRALTEKLEHEGFNVTAAKDGEEGLKLGLEQKPDMILLDIIMPKLDGIKMLKAIRSDVPWGANVPVIILTNSREKGDIVAALAEGVTQYLAKADWKIEDVVKKLKEMLDAAENPAAPPPAQ